MKNNKFTMGEEELIEQPAINNINNTTKKHTRHHVKRRSSGRVHVTKLAPMAKLNANHTDSEVDLDLTDNNNNNNRPVIRRTQSQKSLHRLSMDRKGMAAINPKHRLSAINPPVTDTTEIVVNDDPIETISISSKGVHNPALISHTSIAEPVSQPLNATCNNLIVPDTPVFSINTSSLSLNTKPDTKRSYLKSQFIHTTEESAPHDKPRHSPELRNTTRNNNISRMTPIQSGGMSRTQQKLMLQRQQAQVEDETNPAHPRNMQRLNKEFELMGREYRNIKRYEDPMRSSLLRCMDKHNSHALLNPHPSLTAHRYQHLKGIALSRGVANPPPTNDHLLGINWNASALLDRMFNSTTCR